MAPRLPQASLWTAGRGVLLVVTGLLLVASSRAASADGALPPAEPSPAVAAAAAEEEDAVEETDLADAPAAQSQAEVGGSESRTAQASARARALRRERALARLAATRVVASDPVPESEPVAGLREVKPVTDEWARGARFFGGLRSGIGFAPGGQGPAGTLGLELGVTAFRGLGFGLHVFGIGNPPEVPLLDIPRAEYGMGAAVDVRWYLQTIEPLKLYPTMSVGFMAGPSLDSGANVVLPTLTPGFGARVNIGEVYVSLEMGAASFYIPFVNLAVGWEPTRRVD